MHAADLEQDYPYAPKWHTSILATLFFVGAAGLLSQEARTNERGVLINGLVELSVANATRFYYALAGLGALLALIGVLILLVKIFAKQRVGWTADELVVPAGRFARASRRIPFAEMTDLTVRDVSRQQFFEFRHAGRRYALSKSWMPSEDEFDELVGTATERASRAQQARSHDERSR